MSKQPNFTKLSRDNQAKKRLVAVPDITWLKVKKLALDREENVQAIVTKALDAYTTAAA